MSDVDLMDSVRVGIMVDGRTTLAEFTSVTVDSVASDGGDYGWGISIQTGMQLSLPFEAPVVLRDVVVRGAEDIGILVDGGWADLEGVTVEETSTSGGTLGRGLQLQNWSFGKVTGLRATNNSDSAVFLESPGRPDLDDIDALPLPVELLDCFLGPTAGAAVPGAEGEASDGLAVTQNVTDGEPYPAETFRVVLDGTELGGNERAHVLVETVLIQVGSNNVFGKGAGYPIAAQAEGLVQGLDGGPAPAEVTELGIADALGMNRLPVALDGLED